MAEVERQLEQDRNDIEQTLAVIGERLSPGRLVDQAINSFKEGTGGEMMSSVSRTVGQNPFPLILTGIGLAWLMKATSTTNRQAQRQLASTSAETDAETVDVAERVRNATEAVVRQAGETGEAFQERMTEARAKALAIQRQAGETANAFRERVEDAVRRAQETAAQVGGHAKQAWETSAEALSTGARSTRRQAEQAQNRIQDFYAAEPLVAGAVALAAGALIGALMPPTRVEDRVLGGVGDALRERAAETASTAAERGKMAAAEGLRAASQAYQGAERRRSDTASSPYAGLDRRRGGNGGQPSYDS